MFKSRYFFPLTLFLFCSVLGYSQTAKKYFSSGEKFASTGNTKEAMDNFTKCIELDPNFEKAYVSRAALFEKTGKKQEAVEDYKKAIVFSPKEKELYFNAGRILNDLGKYVDADAMLRQAIDKDHSYQEAIDMELVLIHKVKDFKYGLVVAQYNLDIKKTGASYYHHGVMQDSLKNYIEAEKDYKNSKYYDSKYIMGYVGLALVQVKLGKADEALTVCETALTKDANSMEVFQARSMVYAGKKDYQNALNDITKVVLAKPSSPIFKQRAGYYMKLGQFQNAVNDYTQAVKLDDKDYETYMGRASAYEQIQNYKQAKGDYNKVNALMADNSRVMGLVRDAEKKLFELGRETGKPEVGLTTPKPTDKGAIGVSGDKDDVLMKGWVKDASPMKSITINGALADFRRDSINPEFTMRASGLVKANDVVLVATDIYDNSTTVTYKIEKTETNKPIIALESPAASFDNEIFLDNTGGDLYIKGKIKDESFIETINIEGVLASFSPNTVNPEFSSNISIANKNKIVFTVRDIYGNETIQEFTLNRSGANASVNNPMGNTWVVFIENSKYTNFASLEGPAKDVTSMRTALANYKVAKILHKKDMTKTDLEKFFSIELRDYVKNNNINSLMIWYAGHGKYVSPTGYWVPVDAKTDDEFSYFGINNLKAAMQSYSSRLVHTLVITDACESGPTFLLAVRGGNEDQRCENWELTKAKSSQVFTSAGYELASDNSQFTKTFAGALNNNPDGCISIDKISKKVISAVTAAGNQAPKFGKIKDLEDEGGTFFFIKK